MKGVYSFSRACCKRLQQTEWLERTETCSLTVLGARSPKLRKWQRPPPCRGCSDEPSLCPPPLGAYPRLTPVSGVTLPPPFLPVFDHLCWPIRLTQIIQNKFLLSRSLT